MTAFPYQLPFDYRAFVEELKSLVAKANDFDDEVHAKSPSFRRWHHATTDLFQRVERLGYRDINTGVLGRSFHPDRTRATEQQWREVFARDVHDTLAEFEQIIANFERYGAPSLPSPLLQMLAAGVASTKPIESDKPQNEREALFVARKELSETRDKLEKAIEEKVSLQLQVREVAALPNSSSSPQPPKTFGYGAYIDELRSLIATAVPMGATAWDDPNFRTWKMRVAAIVKRVRAIGYDPQLHVAERMFRPNGAGSDVDFIHAFQRDLQDSQAEMQVLVDQYEKYGPPAKVRDVKDDSSKEELAQSQTVVAKLTTKVSELQLALQTQDTSMQALVDKAKAQPMHVPEKITIPWLWHNLAASTIWAGVVLVVGVFLAGVTVGGWPSVQTAISNVGKPVAIAAPAVAGAAAPTVKAASTP